MTEASATSEPGTRYNASYQFLVVGLLSLNFGILFFDRNALNFLMPFVKPELGLNNTQVGMLASGLSLTWSFAAFGMGRLSDVLGKRKLLLIASTLAFSACSFLSGIAATFAMLLLARLLMGVAEGGVMPISHAIVAAEVDPKRLGLAQGVAQNLGSSLLGSFVAPVVLVAFAVSFGWRNAFYLAGLPGLASALLIWLLVKEPQMPRTPKTAAADKMSMVDALKERNILICVLLSLLGVSYLVICWAFMPLFLIEVRGFSETATGWLMGTLGLSAAFCSFAVSSLSDRIGRRPVMIALPFIAMILPLGALFFGGSLWLLAAIFFVGWMITGTFPLFMATVPSESVDPRYAATVLGLAMGSGEVIGGVFGPSLAGMAADAVGLTAPLWIMLGLAIASGFVALGLRETAPSQRRL
jgi:predicted MFS family arabinose efflux permease